MDRRAFVGAAGASGMVVLGRSPATRNLGPALPHPNTAPLPDMDAYLARVDAGMARIAEWSPTAAYPAFVGDRAALDSIGRKSLQTLFMTGMLGDLPLEGQLHPRMQERLWTAMPMMDEAMDEMTEFLASRTPEELERVQTALRNEPNVRQLIAATLDDEAGRCGVSDYRRRQMRIIASEVGWRLERQPPALVIEEYLDKVRKVSASDIESAARQRWLAAQVSERVFWETQPPASKRTRRLRRGAIVMGIGVVTGIVGAVVAAAESDVGVGAVLLTVGAVFFLVGLIILLVGLATSGDSPPPS